MAVLDYAGLRRYDGKIKQYTGDLVDTVVEVTDVQPVDLYNKIWIETSDEEIVLPEMSDIGDLNDMTESVALMTTVPIDFTIEGSGYVSALTGSIGDSDTTSHTDYIDVSNYGSITYKKLCYTTSLSGMTSGLAFYDANKIFISGIKSAPSQPAFGYMPTLYTEEIPEGVTYVRIGTCTDTDTYGDFEIYGEYKIVTEVKKTRSDLSTFTDITEYTNWNRYKSIATNGSSVDITALDTANIMDCIVVPCVEGDEFVIAGAGSSTYRLWAFVAIDGTTIANYVNSDTEIPDYYLRAPADSAYLVVNSRVAYEHYVYKGVHNKLKADILDTSVAACRVGFSETIKELTGAKPLIFDMIRGVNNLGDIGTKSTYVAMRTRISLKVPCSPGDKFALYVYGDTGAYRAWGFLDSSDIILSRAGANLRSPTIITAPDDAAYLVVIHNVSLMPEGYYVYKLPKGEWDGLRVSLLGDSISALKNYIPSGNGPYYGKSSDPSHSGITSPNQMWWGQVIDGLGAKPLIIDAWSGSCVTKGIRSAPDEDTGTEVYTPMSDVSRCRNLHSYVQTTSGDPNALLVVNEDPGEGQVLLSSIRTSPFDESYTPAAGDYVKRIDPDIVIVEGGTNDYSYIDDAATIGTYNGHTALPAIGEDTASTENFREAYATMLARLHAEYPRALVVCLSCVFNKRPYVTNQQTNRNIDSGLTIMDYNQAIREIAELHQGAYVDAYMQGWTRYNFYGNFASDRNTSTTHPNITGHKVMAENLIPKLREVCKGYVAWLKGEIE